MNDIINAPAHYVEGRKYQPIDVIEDWGLHKNHSLACALKYIARAGRKHDALKDIQKALWYLQREEARLKRES